MGDPNRSLFESVVRLGFSNRWYPTALETAPVLDIAEHRVRVVTPPLFVATKLEAFRARGRGDFLGSHDLEDIVTVFDGRAELPGEIALSPADVRAYIAAELRALLNNRDFQDALSGFLPPDAASQRRRGAIEARLREVAAI